MKNPHAEIDQLFKLAEEKIKLVENLDGLPFPAVNQLRYVAFHLLRAEFAPDEKHRESELRKAKNHCQRAIYDASEIGIMHYLNEFALFQNDYRTTTITDVVPDYLEHRRLANEARNFAASITRKSISDHCENQDDQYQKSGEYFEALRKNNEILQEARPELGKKIQRNRRYFLFAITGLTVAILTLIVTILK
ncbi:hypothetical protein LJC71_08875 [Desulfosarcina sp. OttesenSCG-928-A07]|nr:hypothetical protein [Desulfosarcina sp. OttesenSCG-928-G17]MDL2329839.1 hypothetical protein [Desulfosarcina sp. OttesenSCG-928-A07]